MIIIIYYYSNKIKFVSSSAFNDYLIFLNANSMLNQFKQSLKLQSAANIKRI